MLQGCLSLDITHQNESFLPSKWDKSLPNFPSSHEGKNSLHCLYPNHEIPSVSDAINALRICTRERQSDVALQMHFNLCSNGFNVHEPFCNYLVPMHVECGNLAIAQQTFETVGYRHNQSWTSLFFGFIDSERVDDAFKLYQNMDEKNIDVDNLKLVALLQSSLKLTNSRLRQELHMKIYKQGLEEDILVSNTLLGTYMKCCSSLNEACVVFDMLPMRDVVSWTALIHGFADHGLNDEALACFEQMQSECICPNAVTLVSVLKACCNKQMLDRGREIHVKITLIGLQSNASVYNSLIAMYAKSGSISEAWEMLVVFPFRDLVSWTSVIAGYAEHGPPQKAIVCLKTMQQEGISPDAVALACSLKACGLSGAMEKGCEIHILVLKHGFGKNVLVGNTLVGMYLKLGALIEAQKVFDELPAHDFVSWTTLISGYADNGHSKEAVKAYDEMRIRGVAPGIPTFACVLKACADIYDLEKGLEIHSYVACIGLDGEVLICSGLMDMYISCMALWEAQEVFDKVANKDVVMWTVLIAGYLEHGCSEEALRCFESMQLQGVYPDTAVFACCLKACANLIAIGRGQEMHTMLMKNGLQKNVSVGNALIELYAKRGYLTEAQNTFDTLESPDVVSWTLLIGAHVEKGFHQEALRIYDQMQNLVIADAIVLSCLLNACGSLGAIQKGREIHQLIAEEELEKDHSVGNSLLNMYARCGSLVDAQDVFDTLPNRDVVAWSAMMKGYCRCHDAKMVLCCFEEMQKEAIHPDSVIFTCLLTACSHGSLVSKGLQFYMHMREQYNVVPTVEHHTCVIDLLARSGKLYEGEKMVAFLCPLEAAPWAALLSACKTFSDRELGVRCFRQLAALDSAESAWFAMTADIFTNTGRLADARFLENLRKHAGAMKLPATAQIEINDTVHNFVKGSIQSEDILAAVQKLNARIREEGQLPNVDNVLEPIADVKKEELQCEHAEKLAIAFGILTTPQGSTLRVTKNLRMCNECHASSKIISKIERREIILRDACCTHRFREGLCSCGDLF